MDMLSDKNEKIRKNILGLLKDMNLNDPWMERAKKFFDFSAEMDISLLDGKPPQQLHIWSLNESKVKGIISSIRIDNDFTYTDRYILFMDALDETARMVYYYFDYHFSFDDDMSDPCYHAFSHICENDMQIKARLYCNSVADASDYYGMHFNYNNQLEYAEKDPQFIYETGNQSGSPRLAERFYALALAFAEKDGKCVFSQSDLTKMTYTLLNNAKNANLVDNIYRRYMPMLFMAKNYSKDIDAFIRSNISRKDEHFVTAIAKSVPAKYFNDNIESFFDMLSGLTDTERIIKSTVLAGYQNDCFPTEMAKPENDNKNPYDGNNVYAMLSYEAKHFPEQFYAVMTSTDKISGINAMGFVPDFYYIYYDFLYEIFEKFNPQELKRFTQDRYGDMAEFFISTEADASQASDEIRQYLRGEKDISVLTGVYDILTNPHKNPQFSDLHIRYVIHSLANLPELRKRYIALKTIQDKSPVKNYALDIIRRYLRNNNQQMGQLETLVRSLAEERVPVDDRFALYYDIIDSCYYWNESIKTNMPEMIAGVMKDLSEQMDESYEQLQNSKVVFGRRMYAMYLGKTDTTYRNHRKILLSMCGDSSKEVRKEVIAAVSAHKELEEDVIGLMSAKKQAYRETAAEILNNWGADNYRTLLSECAENEKSLKIADRLREILNQTADSTEMPEGSAAVPAFDAGAYIRSIHKGGRAKKLQWLYETDFPVVHKKDGSAADEAYMQAMLLSYMPFTSPERSADADRLADDLDKRELELYAQEVYSRWWDAGAEAKRKQAMYFAAAYGDGKLVDMMLKCVKEWSENSRGAIAAETVKAVALNGSSQALMAVDNIAHKFKHKQVRAAAGEAIGNAAKILGITSEELGDRIVPDLGFDSEKKRIFDYGTRSFTVSLTPALTLEVADESGKKLKTLPTPGKRDDEKTAKDAYDEFKQLKKQLKNVIGIQSVRLETALISDRRWSKAGWEELFVGNAIMNTFAEGLIWAAYCDGECAGTFRYMNDGSFNDAQGDEYTLPEVCDIGLVHPLELSDEQLEQWKEQLEDYEVVQPVEQLNRAVYRITEEEIGKLDVERFSGRELNALSLVGRAEKYGWYKGSIQDAGGFFEFYREDITSRKKLPDGTERLEGYAAELSFSGTSVGYYEEDVTIENLRFYHPGDVSRGSYVYDKADDSKAILLEKVNPRYFSEIIRQLELITK